MTNMLLFCRYLVFGLFVICNAIFCSVAVWNLSLGQSVGQNMQVDAFCSFVGAFALLFIFTLIFIEILRKNPLTGRLWFEVLWVGLFWIMELSGATAVSAMVPGLMCTQSSVIDNAACTSTHVLLAFSWLSTIILLVYLLCLVCMTIIRQKRDPQIWHMSVVEFCRCDMRHDLKSAPTSPSLPRFHKTSDVIAPQPRRPPPIAVYAYRAGMGPEYQIEHFRPPSSAAEGPVPLMLASSNSSASAPSLHPQHLHTSLTPRQPSRPSPASTPPPLGNWPNPNAVDQPLRSKRKSPPSTFRLTARDTTDPISGPVLTPSSLPRSKPAGPRRCSNENRRPPPLSLTHSAFREGDNSSGSSVSIVDQR